MATPHDDDAPPAPIADDLITMAVERAVQVWEGQNGASIKVNPGPVRVLIEDAYARGRREAIEGGVRFLRTDEGSASAADDLEQWERERREERGSK